VCLEQPQQQQCHNGIALEQLHLCCVCDLQIKNWMKKSQNMLVWLSKMVWAAFLHSLIKGQAKPNTCS
jgi:hypothetical protein